MFGFVQSSPVDGLVVLLRIRVVLLFALLAVAIVSLAWLEIDLPLFPLTVLFALFLFWTLASYWRLHQSWTAGYPEMFLNLMMDTALFTGLLYWTGGATNPFVSLYLLSIVIAAAALPVAYVWAIVSVCVAYYSGLMVFYEPLKPSTGSVSVFSLHIFGMWLNFLLSAILCGVFVAGIAGMARRRGEALAEAREDALRDERIVALGTLAAGVAHELNTPLATMSLTIEELNHLNAESDDFSDRIRLLVRQVETLKERLSTLVESASAGAARSIRLGRFFDRLLASWHIVRPEIDLAMERSESFVDGKIRDEATIAQAVANLLNNAADASMENGSAKIRVSLHADASIVRIIMDDEGPGVTLDQLRQVGRAVHSTKSGGLGLGLMLSSASLERFGGEVVLERRPSGGTRTTITLPRAALDWEQSTGSQGKEALP